MQHWTVLSSGAIRAKVNAWAATTAGQAGDSPPACLPRPPATELTSAGSRAAVAGEVFPSDPGVKNKLRNSMHPKPPTSNGDMAELQEVQTTVAAAPAWPAVSPQRCAISQLPAPFFSAPSTHALFRHTGHRRVVLAPLPAIRLKSFSRFAETLTPPVRVLERAAMVALLL